MGDPNLIINVDLTTRKAIASVNKFEKSTISSVNRMNNSVNQLKGLFATVAIGSFIKKSIDAYDEQEKAIASVRNGLELTGQASGQTLDKLLNDASKLQKETLFGDEQILNDVTAQFLTFGNISGDAFDRAQQAALDLSSKIGTDLRSQTIQLGKALDNPVQGISALTRAGVTFTNQQKKQIKQLVKSGKVYEAQNIILGEIESKYGGAAKAAAEAGAGPLKQLQNRLGDITELIGESLLPIISFFANILSKVVTFIEKNNEAFKQFINILGIAASVIGTIILATKVWGIAQKALNIIMKANPILLVISLVATLAIYIYNLTQTYEGWGKSFTAVGNMFKLEWEKIKLSFSYAGDYIKNMLKTLKERFNNFGERIGNIFSNIGEAIKLAIQGDFSKAKEALLKSTAPDKTELKKLQAENLKLRKEFARKYNKITLEQYKEYKKIGLEKIVKNEEPINIPIKTTLDDKDGILGDKEASVTASRPAAKAVTLNIKNVIETVSISQNQDPLKIKDMVARALTSTLADATAFV
jgi:hypothetical protein